MSSGTGSSLSLKRVPASATASAARSASLKYGDSRHEATPQIRSSGSPASRSSRLCMSTQKLQPLIWLARRWTSLCVVGGMPPFAAAFARASSAWSASGTGPAMFGIRGAIVARVCLNLLRSRRTRREEPLDVHVPDPVVALEADPEQAALLGDAVGLALLVVLETLDPLDAARARLGADTRPRGGR